MIGTFQLCIKTSLHIAGAASTRKQCSKIRSAEQQALLEHVLKTVLTTDYSAAAWQEWIQSPAAPDAPWQIEESQIAVTGLSNLEACHYSVLQFMHKHKAFMKDAWLVMESTMARLAHDALRAGLVGGKRLTAAGNKTCQLHLVTGDGAMALS